MATDKREQILSVAAELFSRQGYHTTTVADIARQADVAQGTVYLYFDSKKAIFSALVDETLALFKDVQLHGVQMLSQMSLGELQQQLPQTFRHILGVIARNSTLVRLMLTEVRGADPEIEAKLAAFYDQVVKEVSSHLKVGIAKGVFRPDMDPFLAAQCLIGIIERFAALIFHGQYSDLDAMAKELAAFELHGIARFDALQSENQDVHVGSM